MSVSALLFDIDAAGVATITLNRPQQHNAFDDALISELQQTLAAAGANDAVRIVALTATGKHFSAGADLKWMRRAADYQEAQNLTDARALAALFETLYRLPKPTVAAVQGLALGGGAGLVCCCDIAIGADDAGFAFTETRLGLIPSTISPYVVRAIGARAARRWFLSGERFDATEAHRIGLLHQLSPADQLMDALQTECKALLQAGPQAQRESKELLDVLNQGMPNAELIEHTAKHIARIRASAEGRAGLAAFLDKKPPPWLR